MTSAMMDLLVRSSLLFGLAALAAVLLRGRGASVQSFALTAALGAALVLPAAAWLPAWELPVLEPVVQVSGAPSQPSRPGDAGLPLKVVPETQQSSSSTLPVSAGAGQSEPPAPAPLFGSASPAWAFLAVWLSGCLVVLFRLTASHARLRMLVRQSAPMGEGHWRSAVRTVSVELGLKRPVVVRASSAVDVPIVTGVLKPVVVVPSAAEGWPPAVVRDVLRHELAHVVRRDAWSQLVSRLACAVYWFNPLAWALAARAASLRERACDDEVLRAGARASEYASRLIVLVRECGADPEVAALAMATRSRIHQRIAHVLSPNVRRGRTGGLTAATTLAFAAAIFTVIGLVEPVRASVVVDGEAISPLYTTLTATQDHGRPAAVGVRPAAPAGQPSVRAAAPVGSPLPAAAAQAGMCSGRMRNSSNTSNSNDGRRRWRVQLSGDGCEVDLQVEGRVEFNSDFTDVSGLDSNGTFRLDTTIDGTRRELDITSRGGSLERTWRVGGREQAWDAAAREGFAQFHVALDRRTAVGVDVRLPHLLRQGGVTAVLAETAQMPSDYARSRYYGGLLDARQLSVAERRQILDQAATLTESDHYANELLERIVAQGRLEDARERDAVVAMLKKMESDHYRAETVNVLAGGSLNADQSRAVLEVLTAMESDHYRHEVLERIVRAAPASVDFTMVSAIIRAMESDHYQAESVKILAARRPEAIQTATLLPMVATMESDHYQNEVLSDLLNTQQSEADLMAAVDIIRKMDSDHYQAEALRDVLANAGATDRVREAVRSAAGTLSQHYRDGVLRRIR